MGGGNRTHDQRIKRPLAPKIPFDQNNVGNALPDFSWIWIIPREGIAKYTRLRYSEGEHTGL